MLNPVSKYFNDRTKRREEEESFFKNQNLLIEAIESKDSQAVSSLFDEIKDSPLLTTHAYDLLLRAAIRTDDVAIFSTLLSAKSSPDYWFNRPSQDMGYAYSEHILYAAIKADSKDIALFLARNKDVSVDTSGMTIQSYGVGKKSTTFTTKVTPYPAPLDLAEQKGMNRVAAVLAARMSREYSARARQAVKAAAALRPKC